MSTTKNTTDPNDSATEQAAGGPSGVSLKAAWLLIKELRRYPALPSIEELAMLLDGVLRYEWAVRLLRLTGEAEFIGYEGGPQSENIEQFNEWAAENLLT